MTILQDIETNISNGQDDDYCGLFRARRRRTAADAAHRRTISTRSSGSATRRQPAMPRGLYDMTDEGSRLRFPPAAAAVRHIRPRRATRRFGRNISTRFASSTARSSTPTRRAIRTRRSTRSSTTISPAGCRRRRSRRSRLRDAAPGAICSASIGSGRDHAAGGDFHGDVHERARAADDHEVLANNVARGAMSAALSRYHRAAQLRRERPSISAA